MNTAITSLPSPAVVPRLGPWLVRASAAVWRSFEATGRARAQRHLLDFADQCQDQQPELAKELHAAAHHNASA